MNILMIDTSGPACGVAIMADGRLVYEAELTHKQSHSQRVMPMVDAALQMSDMTLEDMDVLGAVVGPGSFTGVRLGVCAAKGMAHAVNRPCVPIHALEALSMNFFGFDGLVCPILDARRRQVYCALFDTRDGFPVRVAEDDAIGLDELLERLPKNRRILFCGDGLSVHAQTIVEAMGERAMLAPANLRDLRADAEDPDVSALIL